MRATSIALAILALPVVLPACPALLSDWSIAANGGGDDGGGDSTVPDGASSSGSGGGSASSSGDSSGGSSGGGSDGISGSSSGSSSGDGASEAAPVCESLQGPTALAQDNSGSVGITFHSKINATLVKFVFHNGGYADTVSLQDGMSCAVIASTPVPANVQTFQANVSWPLVANKSYRLVSTLTGSQYNETHAIVSNWPWTDGQNLVVDDCAGGNDHCSSDASSAACGWSHEYWFNFTDLEICE